MTPKNQTTREKRLVVKHELTEAEVNEVQQAALSTWDYIGYDSLQAFVDCGEASDINAVSIPRDEVIEAVLDANRIDGRIKNKATLAKFSKLDYETMQRVVRPAFPFSHYGL
jgi:hypothetical protein